MLGHIEVSSVVKRSLKIPLRWSAVGERANHGLYSSSNGGKKTPPTAQGVPTTCPLSHQGPIITFTLLHCYTENPRSDRFLQGHRRSDLTGPDRDQSVHDRRDLGGPPPDRARGVAGCARGSRGRFANR